MTRMIVRGIGVTGGFGCSVAEFGRALARGTSRPGSFLLPTAEGTIEIPAFRAGIEQLEEYCTKGALRRIDHLSQMGLLGASLALADAGDMEADHSRTGVIVASGFGPTATTVAFLDSMIAGGDICASPTHFANSVHNAPAAHISILFGVTGPSLTVSQFDMSVPSALLSARQWLAEGRVDRVLFGAVDELSDLSCYIGYRSRGLPATSDMTPLMTSGNTAVMGEGAAFLLLTRDEGEAGGYCAIEKVATGRLTGNELPLPSDALLVLAADGRSESGGRYRDAIPATARIACFSPLYGCSPAGPAFDLAAAALILKEGTVFPSPNSDGSDFRCAVAQPGALPAGTRLACLSLGTCGGYGLATLGRL